MVKIWTPGEDALNTPAAEWQEWMQERTPEFTNPEQSAALIVAITQGIKFAIERFSSIKENPPPSFVIAVERNANLGLAAYLPKSNEICITHEFFDPLGHVSLNGPITILHKGGDLYFKGTALDFGFLVGVEEMDHALFHRENIDDTSLLDGYSVDLPLRAYDKQPIEMRALKRKLVVAQELSMPVVTIQCLETRIKLAELYNS